MYMPWTQPDDFTVIAPKLGQSEWELFIKAARKHNKKAESDKLQCN